MYTVLLVHGWISHAARMAEVIRELHARGLRVLAFDAPAHGRSRGTQADLQAFRSALAAVLVGMMKDVGYIFESFTQAMAMNAVVSDPLWWLCRGILGGEMGTTYFATGAAGAWQRR